MQTHTQSIAQLLSISLNFAQEKVPIGCTGVQLCAAVTACYGKRRQPLFEYDDEPSASQQGIDCFAAAPQFIHSLGFAPELCGQNHLTLS